MIDCRLLMIGSCIPNCQSNDKDKFVVFGSNCYVDWISITKVHIENASVEEYFQEWYNTYSQKRIEYLDNYHIQQSFLLVSDEDGICKDMTFEKAPLLYISLISLSSYSDSVSAYHSITEIISDGEVNEARLYHCFDHCNYVLVCNGANCSLENYISVLRKIRNIKDSKGLSIVHDITSLYGYNKERLKNHNASEELKLILSLNQAEDTRIPLAVNEDELRKTWEHVFDCVGRYDQILVSKPTTWKQFCDIAETIEKYQKGLFASRIHICIDSAYNSISKSYGSSEYSVTESNVEDALIHKIKLVFEKNIKDINEKVSNIDSPISVQLNYALHEVYYSIHTMLNRAFSNYFVLCFYESFCKLLEYINKKLLPQKDMRQNEMDYFMENIFDLINSYFVYLRTLTASTLHSERRFVQADPHQLTYFDIPPKLIAFYTAFASKMSRELGRSLKSDNQYTFLIVPDFKKDIYVESLTNNRETQRELNILIIHINEKSMYDVSQTTKILAHEIAHHAGLGLKPRRVRAEKYIKCILASKICTSIDADIYKTVCPDECEDLFSELVDVFIKCFKDEFKIETNLETGIMDCSYVYGGEIPRYFYSDCFIQEYENFLAEKFFDDGYWCEVTEQLYKSKIPWKYFERYFEPTDNNCFLSKLSYAYQEHSQELLKKYAINKFVDNLKNKVQQNYQRLESRFGFGVNPLELIMYVFREGAADIQMLTLIASSNADAINIDNVYNEMFDKLKGRYEYEGNETAVRRMAVRASYLGKDVYDEFERSGSNDSDNFALFYRYLHHNLVEYFRAIPALEKFLSKGSTSNQFDYDKLISPFNKTRDSIEDAVKIIDNIIVKYRDYLAKHDI